MNSCTLCPTVVPWVWGSFRNTQSRIRVIGTFTDDFLVQVGLHQGPMLSPLFFIIVLEALSRKIKAGCLEELLYADDFALISEREKGSLKRRIGVKSVESKC